MNIKKIVLIVTFIAIFTCLFWKGVPITKAYTIEELATRAEQLQTKLNQLSNEINSLQDQINQLKADIAKLREEKPVTLVLPETEYACPDIDGDGKVYVEDLDIIGRTLNTCEGSSSYNPKADFDKDGCVTNTDYNFLSKYWYKNDSDIPQCKGVVIKPPVSEESYACPDIDGDGKVYVGDLDIIGRALNACEGSSSYNPKADFDGDGCVTNTDYNFLSKYWYKNDSDIPQCKGGTTLRDIEKMIASIAEAISQITAGLEKLQKR